MRLHWINPDGSSTVVSTLQEVGQALDNDPQTAAQIAEDLAKEAGNERD